MELFPSSHYALLSILFFIGLELIIVFHSWIWLFTAILLALMVYGIVLVRIEERGRFKPTQVILPLVTASGLTGFTLFLPLNSLIHLYFAASAVIFFVLLRHGARLAYPTWNWLISTIVLFLNIAVALGIRSNLYLGVLTTLLIVFLVSWLVGTQALRRVASSLAHTLLLGAALGLVLTQLTWVILFLPIHFLIQAGIVVVVYYVLFHILSMSLEGRLRRKHIVEYAVLGGIALLSLLVSARWV